MSDSKPSAAAMRVAMDISKKVFYNTSLMSGDPEEMATIIDAEFQPVVEALRAARQLVVTLSWNHAGDAVANAVIEQADRALEDK